MFSASIMGMFVYKEVMSNDAINFIESLNSTTFFDYIRNAPIEDEEIMVSFDIASLYTNIPIIDKRILKES